MNSTLSMSFLFLMGFAGVVLHLLMKMDDVNKQSPGKINFKSFLVMEWIPTLISIIVVSVLIPFSQKIATIQQIGDWAGLAYIAIGYMGQSILYKFMKKADKLTDTLSGSADDTPTKQ